LSGRLTVLRVVVGGGVAVVAKRRVSGPDERGSFFSSLFIYYTFFFRLCRRRRLRGIYTHDVIASPPSYMYIYTHTHTHTCYKFIQMLFGNYLRTWSSTAHILYTHTLKHIYTCRRIQICRALARFLDVSFRLYMSRRHRPRPRGPTLLMYRRWYRTHTLARPGMAARYIIMLI